jgi:hypothetical protein
MTNVIDEIGEAKQPRGHRKSKRMAQREAEALVQAELFSDVTQSVMETEPAIETEMAEEPLTLHLSDLFTEPVSRSALAEQVIEQEPVAESKPAELVGQVIEQEPVSEIEPILKVMEAEPVTETTEKLVAESEPVVEPKPTLDEAISLPVIEPQPKQPINKVSVSLPVPEKQPPVPKSDYSELASIQAMSALNGFAPLGMLFVLMDVLEGAEEGIIRVNKLAEALSIGKPAMLVQIENLERAGLIRTVMSSQRGRHIELLVPNALTRVAGRVDPEDEAAANPAPGWANAPAVLPKNFSLDKLAELNEYLTERGIQVVSVPDESDLDPKVSEIAAFMGKYLKYVQPFYARLKATLNSACEVTVSLKNAFSGRTTSARDVTHILNFGKMLLDAGFLASFSYRRSPHCVATARVNRTPTAINFLSGGWLEHYIRDKAVMVITAHPSTMDTPYAFMKNPRIILPGNEDFEFDFLLMIADRVFWVEAKTGGYLDYIEKYSRVAKLLGLGRSSTLLVLVDSPKPDDNLSARYGLSCCNVDEFAEVFRIAMIRELSASHPIKRGA